MRLWAFVVHDYSQLDFTYSTSSLTIWSCVEVGIAVTCACLPSMKPVFSGVRTWYTRQTSERLTSGRSSPSNPSRHHLMKRRGGDEASRSSSEEAGLCLKEDSQAKADRTQQPSQDCASSFLYPMSNPATTYPGNVNESV